MFFHFIQKECQMLSFPPQGPCHSSNFGCKLLPSFRTPMPWHSAAQKALACAYQPRAWTSPARTEIQALCHSQQKEKLRFCQPKVPRPFPPCTTGQMPTTPKLRPHSCSDACPSWISAFQDCGFKSPHVRLASLLLQKL